MRVYTVCICISAWYLRFICKFVVYSTGRFILCLTLCYFVLLFFSPFSIAITSLGEERANLSAFRTFVRFALVWFCLFSLSLGVWEGLQFVVVTPWTFLLTFFSMIGRIRSCFKLILEMFTLSPSKTVCLSSVYHVYKQVSRQCGSNEYLQSMFLNKYNKNNVYSCRPKFYYIKMGFKGIKVIIIGMFSWCFGFLKYLTIFNL